MHVVKRFSAAWRAIAGLLLFTALGLSLSGCGGATAPEDERGDGPPLTLAAYELFAGDGSSQQPRDGVIPYDINSPLFSDYTSKYRFIKLPPGERITYHETDVFDFPVGTVIAKTFTMPHDLRDPSQGERLLETRILKHEPDGWVGLPYVWNAEETEARLQLAGGTVDVDWIHIDGSQRSNDYIIPNANQCKGCHKAEHATMQPIGPKARHLNRDFDYAHGTENQLVHWAAVGALEGAHQPGDAPRLPVWDDETTGTLDERARAWLEINCAHCHNPNGPARNSGLDLTYHQRRPYEYGVYRSPVAAGRGSGGLAFDIVPGKPNESILLYRIASTHPDTMMPELGKRLVHEEGVELIREWIAAMPEPPRGEAN